MDPRVRQMLRALEAILNGLWCTPSVSGSGSAEHLCGSHVLGPGILR